MHSEKNSTNLSQMPVIDSLDTNFQLVTDCSCKQMHNLFPTVDNSDGQEFVVPFDGAFKLSVLQSWLEA